MDKKKCEGFIGAIILIIFGILVGFLYFIGLLTGIVTALWIALGSATLGLVLLFVLAAFGKREVDHCVCFNTDCLTIGTLGTIILSTVALTIPLIIFNIWISILIGVLAIFMGLSIISMAKLLCCLKRTKCKCRERE